MQTIQLIIWILGGAGLAVDFFGALVLIGGVKSKKVIKEISGTYWNENPWLMNSLLIERRNTIIGLVALISGFALQIISFCLGIVASMLT